MLPPGLSLPDSLASRGSALHLSGNCRPCAWYWKPGGCQNGSDCGHCHLCPEGELKNRKKSKLVMMRLGLATPKPFNEVVDLTGFFPSGDGAGSGSEMESTACSSSPDTTTCSSSPEPEQARKNSSDEDELISSVIGILGLEDAAGSPAHKTLETTSGLSLTAALFPPGLKASPNTLEAPPGLKAPPNTPSHGSTLHATGNCKPCAWFWKPSGCQNGRDCSYCHVCSEGEIKARKKSKHTAMRLGLVTPKTCPTSEQEARYALNLAACL